MICGEGQVLLVAVNVSTSKQDSIITQLGKLLHHPQSSKNMFDTDKHDEHPSAKFAHSYSNTVDKRHYNKIYLPTNTRIKCNQHDENRMWRHAPLSKTSSKTYSTPGPVHVMLTVPVVWLMFGDNTKLPPLMIHTKPSGPVYSAGKTDCDPSYWITHRYV